MAIKQDAAFDAFVATAQSMLGSDLSRDWLFEIWVGADADANRALNHALDSPEDKIRRNGGNSKPAVEAKTPKKSKPSRESKPAPPTPATTWGDDDYVPPSPLPPPQSQPALQQHGPPQMQHQQQAYPQPGAMPYPSQQGMIYPMSQQPMQQPMMQQPGMSQPMMHPLMQQPGMSQQMMQPMIQPAGMSQQMMQPMMQPAGISQQMMQPAGMSQVMIDPMTGLAMAPMNAIQQAQSMFVQQQQQQRLIMLKNCIDSVLSNPSMLMSPQIMQNLQDTMIQALEAPNATLQMAERARQSQQTAQFIHIMQAQVAQMLADPKVATNPALLQQLNSQMNQLRLLTMQHVAQQQIEANPASVLSLSMPLLTPPSPSASLLSRALLKQPQYQLPHQMADEGIAQGVAVNNDEDWWQSTPKASVTNLSEKNPFRDLSTETETNPPLSRRSLSRSLSVPSLTGVPMFGSVPVLQPQQTPLGYFTSAPMLPGSLQQQQSNMMLPGSSVLPYMYGSQQGGYMMPPQSRPF